MKNDLSVGSDRIDIATLKQKFQHLEPIKPTFYSYCVVQIILGQDAFRAIRPIENFESEDHNAPVAVRLPIGWVLSGPVPSTSARGFNVLQSEHRRFSSGRPGPIAVRN